MQKVIALALIVLLSAPTGVFAQPPSSQAVAEEDLWATLQGLTPGTSLQLTLANGQNATGNVVEVRPDAIVISGFSVDPSRVLTRLPDGTVLFLGSAVTRVRVGRVSPIVARAAPQSGHRSTGRLAALGALIGLAAGTLGMLASSDCTQEGGFCGLYVVTGAGMGAGIGAGVGAIVGLARKGSRTAPPAAQPPSPTFQRARAPKWDMDGGIGSLYQFDAESDTRNPSLVQGNWQVEAYRVGLGRYWTTHLKTEASVTMVPRGFGTYDVETVPVAGLPQGADIFTERESTLTQMTLGGSYQFLENAFVHPFLMAGVQTGWLRVHRFRAERAFTESNGTFVVRYRALALDERYTETLASALVGGGAKVYVNRRIFVRPELLCAFGGAITETTARLGVGVDF